MNARRCTIKSESFWSDEVVVPVVFQQLGRDAEECAWPLRGEHFALAPAGFDAAGPEQDHTPDLGDDAGQIVCDRDQAAPRLRTVHTT